MKITLAEAAVILGLDISCRDESEISKAYRRQALKFHPDKAAVELSKEVAGAWARRKCEKEEWGRE
jgi:curved DNA-binding protein CbpA